MIAEVDASALARRLTWLTALRLTVLTVFLVGTAVRFGGFTLGGYSNLFALSTLAVAYLLAALYAAVLRSGRLLLPVAAVQLVTDQAIWTALVYVTGTVYSGVTSLYGLTCLCGAILLGTLGGLLAAGSAAAGFLSLCYGLATGLIPLPPDQSASILLPRGPDFGYPIFVNLLGLAVVTLLAVYLAERLRVAGGHLEEAKRRAAQAEHLAALGRLAAGLAHEIRNPLGSIAGSVELLRTGGTLCEEDKRLCELVERETARLNDLVGDMLDLARRREPVREPVDVAAMACEVARLAGGVGRGADVRIRYEGVGSAWVFADPGQLRQVVWNLLRNAIQASAAGDEVLVRCSTAAGRHHLQIIDRGPGIPAEARERLFDAFVTTRAHGMGIGLAVVKRIVDDHGFPIEVESREGEGACLSVRFPAWKVGAEASPAADGATASVAPAPVE